MPATATSCPGPLPPLAIPTTLHDSLMARLDRLGTGQGGRADRRGDRPGVLPRAARGGGRPAANQLRDALEQLVAPSWCSAAARRPRRSTASSTRWSRTPPTSRCSSRSRQQLHARIAQVLEEQFPDAPRPSQRSWRATARRRGCTEKAIDYWYGAGELARPLGQSRSDRPLSQGLELVATLPDPRTRSTGIGPPVGARGPLSATKGFAAPRWSGPTDVRGHCAHSWVMPICFRRFWGCGTPTCTRRVFRARPLISPSSWSCSQRRLGRRSFPVHWRTRARARRGCSRPVRRAQRARREGIQSTIRSRPGRSAHLLLYTDEPASCAGCIRRGLFGSLAFRAGPGRIGAGARPGHRLAHP